MQEMPSGICDSCSKSFFKNDSRLKQVSNECHDLFKLEFCNSTCLKNIEKDYPFIKDFEFKNIQITKEAKNFGGDSDSDSESEFQKDLFNTLVMNYQNVVFDFSNNIPNIKKSYQIYEYYYNLKKNDVREITKKDKYFLKFADRYNLFNINK